MICEKERRHVLIMKKLLAVGAVSEKSTLFSVELYRQALLAHRKATGKKFWIPRDVRRLLQVTNEFNRW